VRGQSGNWLSYLDKMAEANSVKNSYLKIETAVLKPAHKNI